MIDSKADLISIEIIIFFRPRQLWKPLRLYRWKPGLKTCPSPSHGH